jgi:hypothetical protein
MAEEIGRALIVIKYHHYYLLQKETMGHLQSLFRQRNL